MKVRAFRLRKKKTHNDEERAIPLNLGRNLAASKLLGREYVTAADFNSHVRETLLGLERTAPIMINARFGDEDISHLSKLKPGNSFILYVQVSETDELAIRMIVTSVGQQRIP